MHKYELKRFIEISVVDMLLCVCLKHSQNLVTVYKQFYMVINANKKQQNTTSCAVLQPNIQNTSDI